MRNNMFAETSKFTIYSDTDKLIQIVLCKPSREKKKKASSSIYLRIFRGSLIKQLNVQVFFPFHIYSIPLDE